MVNRPGRNPPGPLFCARCGNRLAELANGLVWIAPDGHPLHEDRAAYGKLKCSDGGGIAALPKSITTRSAQRSPAERKAEQMAGQLAMFEA